MAAQERFFHSGQVIFREGDPSRSMYLISQGTVSIRKGKGVSFVEIAKVHSNEVIGELAFLDRLPRSATAVAISEVKLLEIDFEPIDKIYAGVPDYLKAIISATADRLRRADETIRRLQKGGSAATQAPTAPAEEARSDGKSELSDALAATMGIGHPPKPGEGSGGGSSDSS